jgi:hypothetical protein
MYAESRLGKWFQGIALTFMVAFLGYGFLTGHYGVPAAELKKWPVVSIDGQVTDLQTWHSHSRYSGDSRGWNTFHSGRYVVAQNLSSICDSLESGQLPYAGQLLDKLNEWNNTGDSVAMTLAVPKPSRITDASHCDGVSVNDDHFEYQGRIVSVLEGIRSSVRPSPAAVPGGAQPV